MPHQTKPMLVRCRAPRQTDLFAGEPQMTIGDTPAWSGLMTGLRAIPVAVGMLQDRRRLCLW